MQRPILDDPEAWRLVTPAGAPGAPPPRHHASLVWDARAGRQRGGAYAASPAGFFVFCGTSDGGRTNEIWVYEPGLSRNLPA